MHVRSSVSTALHPRLAPPPPLPHLPSFKTHLPYYVISLHLSFTRTHPLQLLLVPARTSRGALITKVLDGIGTATARTRSATGTGTAATRTTIHTAHNYNLAVLTSAATTRTGSAGRTSTATIRTASATAMQHHPPRSTRRHSNNITA